VHGLIFLYVRYCPPRHNDGDIQAEHTLCRYPFPRFIVAHVAGRDNSLGFFPFWEANRSLAYHVTVSTGGKEGFVMNSRERMCKVLNHEIPDRLPTFEYGIDKIVVEAFCQGGTYADLVEFFDLDCITAWETSTGGFVPGRANVLSAGEVFKDEWGVLRKASGEMSAYPNEEGAPIRDESDLKSYRLPDPDMEMRYEMLRQYVKRFRGEKLVSYAIFGTWEMSTYLMGLTEFLISFVQRPQLIKQIFELITDWVIKVANNAIDIGADMIIFVSDIGHKKGLWVRPELMEEFYIPCIKRVVDAVKKRRAYLFHHSHGNIWSLLDALVDTGIDVIHPLAVQDMMDIEIVKRIFGRRIVVAGNVSTDLLTRGSEDEIQCVVKEMIANTSSGGGHIAMASSSVYSGVKPSNYKTMIETIRKFGCYN
jgi:uroporphyrinogen decarboxylase